MSGARDMPTRITSSGFLTVFSAGPENPHLNVETVANAAMRPGQTRS
ncbi:hypothetical protein P3T40_005491 [Paraburkholderia sp. EB58]|jgi:hypothetical protein